MNWRDVHPRVSPGATINLSLREKWWRFARVRFLRDLGFRRYELLQGLKPGVDLIRIIGPAEARALVTEL